MTKAANRRIVLASRPQGAPVPENFRLEESPVPTPGDGEILVRNLFLSLDPYMRGRMNDGPSYAPPLAIGEVMVGGTVGRVEASRHPGFRQGDLVSARGGWQDYALCDSESVIKLAPDAEHPSYALSVLGMPGFTAWHGLLDIGAPKAGDTVVVAAASGPVGSIVGQIARLKGCRVVGIAGGTDKCRFILDELGFDAAIDRRDPNFAKALEQAVPKGIDVYFENVGGAVLDAVLPLLNDHARIPLCGVIADYNNKAGLPEGPDRLPRLMRIVLAKRIKLQGFIIIDHYGPAFDRFSKEMGQWVAEGKVKLREDIVNGLENAPRELIGLLQGENFGKLVIRIA